MINVVKELKGNVLLVRLTGSVDETVNFEELIGNPPREVHVNCKGIQRLNSIGVKAWMKYFLGLSAKGIKIKFQECPTSIVDQINLISNFHCGGEVESIFVPYVCKGCGSELVGVFKTVALKKAQFKLPELKCSKCGGSAEFDDIPNEYFGFLINQDE